jgi:hypothetical protein
MRADTIDMGSVRGAARKGDVNMLRGTLMRGGMCLLLIAVLWAPVASAWPGPSKAADAGPGVSAPEPLGVSGWLDVLDSLLRVLTGAADTEGGGPFDPNGTTGDGSGGTSGGTGGTTTTTTTTTTTDTSSSGLQTSSGS